MTSTATLQVAQTIRDQLGNRFCVMTGAKDFVGSERSLSFRIGRNIRNVTHVRDYPQRRGPVRRGIHERSRHGTVNRAQGANRRFGVYADRLAAETIGRVHSGCAVTL
jgi:hypothetical protein